MRVGKLALVIFGCFSFTGISYSATTTALSQWNISFQFSNDCVYGTFVNGDYWVVAPVVVTNMTPAWDGIYNGWEINPTTQVTNQGFSSNTSTGPIYSELLRPVMPFTLTTNCSLVKTVGGSGSASTVKTAAVLTVLSAVPDDNGAYTFRPPYVGTNKPLYKISNLLSNILPSYPSVPNMPTLVTVESNFSKCPRMDHHPNVPRWFRPLSAMDDYQPANTIILNESMLRLMMDDSYAAKLPALIKFTQHAIDKAYAVYLGYRDIDDGHDPNNRVVAAWAATLLDITEIKTLLTTATGFHEDRFLIAGLNEVVWGQSGYPESFYWNYIMTGSGSKSIKDPYGYIDGGALTSVGASYQNIVSQSFKGQTIIYKLFPQLINCIPSTEKYNLFRYSQRWVNHGVFAIPDPAAPYDGIPANYGITFGPDGHGSFIPGIGRFTIYDGANRDGGQYKSLFVSNMWYAYWTFPEMTINGKATFRGKATIR